MTKKDLLNSIVSFDDDSILLFSGDVYDFLDLDSLGLSISKVVEVSTGTKKYVVLSE